MIERLNEQYEKSTPFSKSDLIRVFAGLLILTALLSRNPFDPTPFNLLWPLGGIRNLLSLPGALLSGLLFDLFGWTSLFIPAFLLVLRIKSPGKKVRILFLNSIDFLLLVSFVALCFPSGNQYIALFTGFWGVIASDALLSFPGRLISILITLLYLIKQTQEYRINLKIFEISKFLFRFLLWNGQRRMTSLAAGLFQILVGARILWTSKFKPIATKQYQSLAEKLGVYQKRVRDWISRRLLVRSFNHIYLTYSGAIKTKLESLNDREERDKSNSATEEYEIFQEALREFEREFYPEFMAEPL